MQRLDINRNGINGWYCQTYGLYNDILRINCQYCDELRDDALVDVAAKVRIRRGTMNAEPEFDDTPEPNDKETAQELYAKFFTRWDNKELAQASTEAILAVQDMNDQQMTAWIQDMSNIALKAKVMTSSAQEYQRQQRAKKLKSGKPWLVPTDHEHTIWPNEHPTDKPQRQPSSPRRSKIEKIGDDLLSIMSAEDAQELMSGKLKGNVKLGAFKKPESKIPAKLETIATQSDEPFDFSKLTE